MHIFFPRLVMVWHQSQNARIQRLGVVQDKAQMADLGQQAHAFGMIARFHQKTADQRLGGIDFAVGKKDLGVDDGRGKAAQMRDMAAGKLGAALVPRHAVEPVQHAPAHDQGRVDRNRRAQIEDGRRRIAARHVAQPAFEMHLAEIGMMLRKPLQRGECGIGLLHHAQRMRLDQQKVAVCRIDGQQVLGSAGSRGIFTLCLKGMEGS